LKIDNFNATGNPNASGSKKIKTENTYFLTEE